jgi:hypothetical protein
VIHLAWEIAREPPPIAASPTGVGRRHICRTGTVVCMSASDLVFAVEEAPEGGYVARALGETIITEADDLESLREMIRDAVRCHFDEDDRPRVVRLHLVRDELLAV